MAVWPDVAAWPWPWPDGRDLYWLYGQKVVGRFSFYPAQHKRDHGDATTVLQLDSHGVQAAMSMTEIYVEGNDHGSRGSSAASFHSVAAMIMIYPPPDDIHPPHDIISSPAVLSGRPVA